MKHIKATNKPPFQSKQEVIIQAPLMQVWEFNRDLSKIPHYHPRVHKVDCISGTSYREPGVSYRCHLKDGKNTCVERDIEVIPLEKIVTSLPEDTMGIAKILPGYIVETLFTALDENITKMEFYHYYETKSFKAKLLNSFIKWKIGKEAQATLFAIKKEIEQEAPY